jgi:hypothetical protein
MPFSWRDPFDTPSDSLLTVRAGLYLGPIPGIGGGEQGHGPARFIGGGRPQGFLGSFVNPIGPVWGWLDFLDEGLRWRPRPRTARWGYVTFQIPWGEIAGVGGSTMWLDDGPMETLMKVSTVTEDTVEFTVPREYRARISEVLERFLEKPTPDNSGPFALP